jgi:hypothetical protein
MMARETVIVGSKEWWQAVVRHQEPAITGYRDMVEQLCQKDMQHSACLFIDMYDFWADLSCIDGATDVVNNLFTDDNGERI